MQPQLLHLTGKVVDDYRWVKQDCPICETPPTRFLGQRGGAAHRQNFGVLTEIWACGKCGLIFPNPMPLPVNGFSQHYGMEADDYFENHDSNQRLENARILIEKAEKFLGRKGKLVDIGVGRGETLKAALEKGWEVVGIEPSESFANYVEKNTGAKIYRKPFEECGFSDNEFDVVILAAVLEHLYNPNEVVREISRTLKSGGLIFFDIPNENGLYFTVGNFYQKIRGRNWVVNLAPTFSPFHVFGFTPKSARKMLDKHGFKVKEWKIYGGNSLVPQTASLVSRVEQSLAKIVTNVSNLIQMGTYIEVWGEKK